MEALGIIGTVFTVVGVLQQASAASSAAEYNARVAEQNAIMSRQQTAEAERIQRISSAKQIGAMRAAYGASGVTADGSPLDVLGESAHNAEIDALTIRYKGEVAARGYGNQAALDTMQADNALTAGAAKAGGVVADYFAKKPGKAGSNLLLSGGTAGTSPNLGEF